MSAIRTRDYPSQSLDIDTSQPPTLVIDSPTPRAFTFSFNPTDTSRLARAFEPDLQDLAFSDLIRTHTLVSPSDTSCTISSSRSVLSTTSKTFSSTLSSPHKWRKSSICSDIERSPKKGDDDYIKHPENAFILFRRKCCENCQATQDIALDRTEKKQRSAELSKTISQQWMALSLEGRLYWHELAKEKKKEHEQMYPNYVYRPQRIKDRTGKKGECVAEGNLESSISSVLPLCAPAGSKYHTRSSSVPTPPPLQTIQIPSVFVPSCPTSPSMVLTPSSQYSSDSQNQDGFEQACYCHLARISPQYPPPPDLTLYLIRTENQHLAGGGFSDVYKCWYENGSARTEVAVKAFRFTFTMEDNAGDKGTKMLRRELGIWKRLGHVNIVPFLGTAYGFGMSGATSLVSLWMPNGSLYKFLQSHDGTLHAIHRLQFLLDIADGLQYLHSLSVVHGDLNCNNVLVDEDYTLRLVDFGYASLVGNIPEALHYLQMSTTRPGALRWAAPEQLNPEIPSSRTTKSDVYSFGCIALQENLRVGPELSQVLSGKVPWSEVREDMAIAFRLAQGHTPDRPTSRPIDDSHWKLIQHCWSRLQERPTVQMIILVIKRFSKECPQSLSLRELLAPSSSLTDANTLAYESSSSPYQSVILADHSDSRAGQIASDKKGQDTIASLPDTLSVGGRRKLGFSHSRSAENSGSNAPGRKRRRL